MKKLFTALVLLPAMLAAQSLPSPHVNNLTANTVNGNTITTGTGTLTLAPAKSLTVSNSLTLAGTDGTTLTFPTTSATLARTDAANTFTGHQTIEGVTTTGATGTGNLVFGTSPTLATPTVSGGTIDNATIGGTTAVGAAFSRISNKSTATTTTKTPAGAEVLSNHWLYGSTFWNGTVSSGTAGMDSQITPNAVIFTDGVDASTATEPVTGMLVLHAANASGLASGVQVTRNALQARMAVTGQYGATGYTAFVAQQSIAWANHNQGGPGGWPGYPTSYTAYYRGDLFGGDDFAWLASGATNFSTVIGREIEAKIYPGANSYARVDVLLIDKVGGVQADNDDVMLAMLSGNEGGTAPGFKTGISFGLSWGEFPIVAGGTLITIKPRDYPTPATPNTVAYGIDFTHGVFSTASFAAPGFSVDPDGDTTVKSITATGSPLGYGTGAGGTVAQGSSKSTGVVVNKPSMQITMNGAALAGGAKVSFAVSDSVVAATDVPVCAVASGGTANAYRAAVTAVASTTFTVTVENITGGSLSESPVVNCNVIKGSSS